MSEEQGFSGWGSIPEQSTEDAGSEWRETREKGDVTLTENKVNEAAENLTATFREAYSTVLDNAVAAQERNVKFAQSWFENGIEELKGQADGSRAVTEALIQQSQKQREAVQTLTHEWVNSYMDLLYAPLSYYKEGLEAVKEADQQ